MSVYWIIGWAVGLVVVLIAATLLLVIIAFGRRIAAQADAITEGLDGAYRSTDPLWDVPRINLAVDRIIRALALAREAVTR